MDKNIIGILRYNNIYREKEKKEQIYCTNYKYNIIYANNKNRIENKIKIFQSKIYNTIIKLVLMINLIIQKSISNKSNLLEYNFSNITLKIKGIGHRNILGNVKRFQFNSSNYPNEVYINGDKQNLITHEYYFNYTDNTVELIWNNSINNCSCMFYKCDYITEIDF